MSKRSFLTRSAEERLKVQKKYSKQIDRWINQRMKLLGRLWKKKLAALAAKLVLVAAAIAGGFAAGKAAMDKVVAGKRG